MATIKFMYNGIKIDGKLVKGSWGANGYTNGAKYCFYADSYYCPELRGLFTVRNDSDMMTDYFEKDSIFFFDGGEYTEQAAAAYKNQELKRVTRYIKKLELMRDKQPERFERYYKTDYELTKERLNKLAA